MSDKQTLQSVEPAPRRPLAERPAVAALIVFGPIIIALVLTIIMVLSRQK